jgi:DMSO/TMAO reductase YedYZ molybdopterin-dependent catalytic subunit
MTSTSARPSELARVAEQDEAISLDELRLAARNHGMPLEVLRHDITPQGLHYLLVHYDIPFLDPDAWQLSVTGAVDRPLTLDLAQLRSRPSVTHAVTLECAGNGRARMLPRPISQPWLDEAVGTAHWTGAPLSPILAEAGLTADAVDVVFTGHDHGIERGVEQDYARALAVGAATADEVLLAYEMNGAPLPPQHGAPVRLIVPGWYGMAHVKWLREITVLAERFAGFQNATAYRIKQAPDEQGEPVTRLRPKALMTPPGFPDFQTRRRITDSGDVPLSGRAWSGAGAVVKVEVSDDGGATWQPAELGRPVGPHAWRSWQLTWRAGTPGDYELRVRATDETGQTQPVEQPWNRQGMANNMAQRVLVTVR